MVSSRAVVASMLGVILAGAGLRGQTSGHYREFRLGADIASVSALTGVKASEAKTVRTRPAMLQDLEWQRPFSLSDETLVDPVQQITFSFYNDQLFRLVVDYDRERTEGLTDADMIEAISTMYGAPVLSTAKPARAPVPAIDAACGTKVAAWGDDEYTAVLCRASYGSALRLAVTSVRLDALAKSAEAQALQLDERDAPQRELARRKREAEEVQASQERARRANKPTFKP